METHQDKHAYVKVGDVVTLFCDQANGWMTSGDLVVGYGLWVPKLKEKMAVPPRIRETRMQIVPKLYYSSRKAYMKERTTLEDNNESNSKKLQQLRNAVDVEEKQNQAEFDRLQGEDLTYGQIVQLRHISGNYVTVKRTMAKFETQCLKISMDETGDEGSWFKMEPAFKFRTLGSRIPYGDSVKFFSVKFEQCIHVSPLSLPFRNLYINGVHEINASPTASYFQMTAFATTGESPNVRGGEAVAIFHSEINAYLMFDPVVPQKGVFWRHKQKKSSGGRQSSNALWIIEAEKAECGGEDVLAVEGVDTNETPKKKGYRLEHVCSGKYLALSASVVEGITALTMTDHFVNPNSLWYFHTKNEDREHEGENSVIQFESDSPLYLEHSTSSWLTHVIPDKNFRLSTPLFADARDYIAGLRKDVCMTDSLSLLQSDKSSMAQISQLMKLMKPIEFYTTSRKASAPNLKTVCTEHLCSVVGMVKGARPCSVASEPVGSPLKPKLKPVTPTLSSTSCKVSGNASSRSEGKGQDIDEIHLIFRDDFKEALDNHVHHLRATNKKQNLAKLFWMVARVRAITLIRQLETETKQNQASILSKQLAELTECLEGIKRWLGYCPLEGEVVQRWQQKTIRNQGALQQLQDFLDWMSNCGFCCNGGWSPKSGKGQLKTANMRVVRASLMFLKVSNLVYDIFRRACVQYPKNAVVFERQMPLFDLHLGTELRAALLMRQMFMNSSILNSLQEHDVCRYIALTAAQRKPAFVKLLQSLVCMGSQPQVVNQQRVAQFLLQDRKKALPQVKVLSEDSDQRILIKKHMGSEEDGREDEWLDLFAYRGKAMECTRNAAMGDGGAMALVFYEECLRLFHDLCAGRNRQAVINLAENDLGLTYREILGALKSNLIPNEIRCRLGHMMIVMYLDRDPQQSRSPIENEYVWSQVNEQPLTARPQIDPFSSMPVLSVTPGFPDLKKQVLECLKQVISSEVPEQGVESALDLLSMYCKTASKLCEYGFFSPLSQKDAAIMELQQLLDLVFKNLKDGKLIEEGLKAVPKIKKLARALQLQLAGLLAFGMAKRIELRKQDLLIAYDSAFKESSTRETPFWNETTLQRIAQSMQHDPLFNTFKKGSFFSSKEDGLTAVLVSLVGADDCLELQVLALQLLMQDACQQEELGKIIQNLEILVSDDAVKCFNTLCVCDGHIRTEAQSLTKNEAKGMDLVLRSLQTLVKMLDPEQHGDHGEQLVVDLKKLMRLRSVHNHVIALLRMPFERVHNPKIGCDELKDPKLLVIINACFEFIREFCRYDPVNQEQVFPHIWTFIEHLNVKDLNAPEALSATVENNELLLNKLPDKVLRRFVTEIARQGKIARFLRFLKLVTSVHDEPFKRTQDTVLRLLQEEKELIFELDGNKGANQGAEDEIANVLTQEGNETRFEMMLRKEYEARDSFLEYHVECFELLTQCAAGKAVANKIKCQSFMSFEQVLEAILDLELLDRLAGDTRKHDADALRYIRTAIVRFLHEVYINMNDPRTLRELSMEGNRMYGFGPTPHPKDRWRNQQGLLDHFAHELELLVKRSRTLKDPRAHRKENRRSCGVQKTLPGDPLEFHYVYVMKAIVPCLNDYYGGRHYSFTFRGGNKNSEECVLAAHRVAAVVNHLLEAPDFLSRDDSRTCILLLENLGRCGVKVPHEVDFVLPGEASSSRLLTMNGTTSSGDLFKESWIKFYHEVHLLGKKTADKNAGTRGMASLLIAKPAVVSNLVHAVVCTADGDDSSLMSTDNFCLDCLKAVRGAMYLAASKASDVDDNWTRFLRDRPVRPSTKATLYNAVCAQCSLAAPSSPLLVPAPAPTPPELEEKGLRLLEAGVLKLTFTLVTHANEDIVLGAVRLASEILHACPREAQDNAVAVLKEIGAERFFSCLQTCLQRFAEDAKHRRKEEKRRGKSKKEKQEAGTESCRESGEERMYRGTGTCELLEMLERLCKGHQTLQHLLRKHHVLIALVDFLEDIERNIMTAIMTDDYVTILTVVKGLHVLSQAIGGPNNKNRLVLTRTNVLPLMNRLFAKLGYSTEEVDAVQEGFKAAIRSSAMRLLADLVQTPIEPLVAKRVIDTLDWPLLLRSWPDVHAAFERTLVPLRLSKETFLLRHGHDSTPSIFHFLDEFSQLLIHLRHSPQALDDLSPGSGACKTDAMEKVGVTMQQADGVKSTRNRAADMARESFLLALTLLILQGENVSAYYPNIQKRQELLMEIVDEEIKDTAGFYTDRIKSVEIVRKHVLQRLYYYLPESAISILANKHITDRLDRTLYDDLPTDNESERQEALLERMSKCASDLICEVELSAGATNWVLTHKRKLEDVPMWIAVMLNMFFIIFFEEHGPAAEVCLPSGRYFDFGHFGLPFFQHATWLMLLISILHGISCGLRFYASVLERYPYHVYLERRQLVIQKEKEEHESAEVTILDSTVIHAAALRSTATDGQIIFNGILLGSSLLGLIWTPFFFAIPLVDLMRTPTVKTLLGSVQHNADKLGQGALVGALLVYAHSILGYAFFRHQHQEGKCNNLFECTMNYLIGGMKGDSIDGVLQDLDIPGALWRDPDMWARIALDMSFYTIIPLVLLSIISGIIIDGFGELRDEMNEAKEYREATSVVCGVSRLTMEQFAPGSFDKHVQSAQNPYHYICLLLHLELQDQSMDTWQETFVRSQVRDQQTDFLPKGAALCLTHMEKDDRDKGNEMETTVALLKALNIRVRSMEKDIRWMQAQQNIALRPLDAAEQALMAEKDDWLGGMGKFSAMGMGNFPSFDLSGIPSMGGLSGMPKMPELAMPSLNMRMPELKMPGMEMSQMKLPDMPKMPNIPGMGIPNIPGMSGGGGDADKQECKQQ